MGVRQIVGRRLPTQRAFREALHVWAKAMWTDETGAEAAFPSFEELRETNGGAAYAEPVPRVAASAQAAAQRLDDRVAQLAA